MKADGRFRRYFLTGGLTSAIALTAGAAYAAAEPNEAVTTVETVVVTATKRDENLQVVPVSVSAVTEKDIKAAGITRIEQIATQVPNLTYAETTTKKITQLVVRGMSQSGGIGNDPNIGVYIDGVYIGRDSGFNMGLMDISRVEVLKGPQGTVFGRNSATGAISITTRKPTSEPSLAIDASLGDYQLRRIGVTANGPLGDNVAGKLTVSHTSRDGYLKNSYGGTANPVDNTMVRGQLLFTPIEGLEITLSGDYSRDRGNGNNYVTASLTTPVNYDRVTSIPNLGYENQDIGGLAATVEYSFAGGYKLTSITAYREIQFKAFNDSDYSAREIGTLGDNRDQNQVSQEIRIASPAGQPLEWVGGLYYFNQDFKANTHVVSGRDTVFAFGCAYVNSFFCSKIGSGLNPTSFGLPLDATKIDTAAGIKTNSYAAFASGAYHLSPEWTVRAGLRYSRDDKDFTFTQVSDALSQLFKYRTMDCADPKFGCQTRREDSQWQPMAALEYHPTDAVMMYGRYSKGYTAGGFNANLNSGTNPLSFAPESVDAYELGLKSQFAENRIRLNLAAFSMDYKDKQESFYSAAAGGYVQGNAGGARSRGFEAELTAILAPSLELNAAVGYNDAKYTSYGANTGHRLANAPEWQGNVSLDYSREMTSQFNLVARADVFYQGDRFLGADNNPFYVMGETTLVNARLGLASADGRWTVTAWARNLLDDKAINQIFGGSSPFFPSYNYSPSNPRTVGVDLSLRF